MRNLLFLFFFPLIGFNQSSGVVQSEGVPLSDVSVWVLKYEKGTTTNEKGLFTKDRKRVLFHPTSEKEIFDFLEEPYTLPKNRE
mgnify:CR=1 FL=1